MNAIVPKQGKAPPEDPVGSYDPRRMAFFHFIFARFFGKHMRAARVAQWGMPRDYGDRPLVVFANHPGWWDGVAFMLLSVGLFPKRRMFTPMDKAALDKYAFMRRLGVFGIETGTPRGAVAFLRTAQQVLTAPDRMLWMNAPGRFADVRERPVPLAPGVKRLPEIAPDAVLVPLAFEYVHWTEKRGEALMAFGPPLDARALLAEDRDTRTETIRAAMTETMDRLAQDAISRDPERFRIVLDGRAGMGGIYGAWQYIRSVMRGERHDPRHDTRGRRPEQRD